MTAWQRSRITERTEKGIGAVSFKRLLLGGGAGALFAMVGGQIIGFFPACLGAGLTLALLLLITHPFEGMPLIAYGLRTLRGLATVAAARGEAGPLALVGQVLKVSPDEGRLEAGSVYDPAWKDGEDEDPLPADWEYLGRFADAGREGLSAAHNPFGGEAL